MAFATTNTQVPMGAATILHVVDSFLNLKNTVTDWNEVRVTRKILSRLSANQLQDIGLTRSDLF